MTDPVKEYGKHMTAVRNVAKLSALTAEVERLRGLLEGVTSPLVRSDGWSHLRCSVCDHCWSKREYMPLEKEHHADDCAVGKARSALAASAGGQGKEGHG